MANPDGCPGNLVASHPRNSSAVKHGVFSRTGRVLAPRAEEIAQHVLAAPHTSVLDAIGAEEIGALVALIEAADQDVAQRGVVNRNGWAREVVKIRLQASRRLQEWLSAYGLTPRGRATFAATLAQGRVSVAEAMKRESEVSP